MITLYYGSGSPYAWRVQLALEHKALEYDRKVVRYVYLGEPLDVKTLPAFCTDHQDGCSAFGALTTDDAPTR